MNSFTISAGLNYIELIAIYVAFITQQVRA